MKYKQTKGLGMDQNLLLQTTVSVRNEQLLASAEYQKIKPNKIMWHHVSKKEEDCQPVFSLW